MDFAGNLRWVKNGSNTMDFVDDFANSNIMGVKKTHRRWKVLGAESPCLGGPETRSTGVLLDASEMLHVCSGPQSYMQTGMGVEFHKLNGIIRCYDML